MKNRTTHNFLGLGAKNSNFDSSQVVILPVPYEQTVSYKSGTRNGPQAIIDASKYIEFYDIELKKDISSVGICTLNELEPIMSGPSDMCDEVYKIASKILKKNKLLVMVGGEHSISVGTVKAHHEKYSDLTVLQFDAHLDLRDSYLGTPYSHASTMRRIKEFCPAVHVGIRSMSEEESIFIDESNVFVFYAKDIVLSDSWEEELLDRLTENVYITFDLDSLDPSIMPSVGTPEPGGLYWYDVLGILRKVSQKKNIVGFDIVELCPVLQNWAPDFLAAKLIYKLIGYIYNNKSIGLG